MLTYIRSLKYHRLACPILRKPAFLLFLALIYLMPAHAEVEQPDGYRMELYDDEVPAGLTGATTITSAQIKQLQETIGLAVIDVIPEHRRPDFLPENQIWIPVPHKGIPGAVWLPDVGFGVLSDVTQAYFKRHLYDATRGNRNHPVAFYCRANCWMSWNAAKRALSYGYTQVYWFAEGVDEWLFEGFDFEILQAAEGKRQADQEEN